MALISLSNTFPTALYVTKGLDGRNTALDGVTGKKVAIFGERYNPTKRTEITRVCGEVRTCNKVATICYGLSFDFMQIHYI
ncbi:MAG: hypothetical protein V7K48_14035 [Nostoc sp.]|uniref:hypothetical protein n=1 Tax=Nostoc sp. TaxID=1180 RepID=UPI002FF5443D